MERRKLGRFFLSLFLLWILLPKYPCPSCLCAFVFAILGVSFCTRSLFFFFLFLAFTLKPLIACAYLLSKFFSSASWNQIRFRFRSLVFFVFFPLSVSPSVLSMRNYIRGTQFSFLFFLYYCSYTLNQNNIFRLYHTILFKLIFTYKNPNTCIFPSMYPTPAHLFPLLHEKIPPYR